MQRVEQENGDTSMGGISGGHTPPASFEKTMVFIDGSNVFPNFREIDLKIPSFYKLAEMTKGARQLLRVCLYTTKEKLDAAREFHGEDCFSGCRVTLGDSVPLTNGGHREKGVDALLVADLIYHAAMKNFHQAIVISNDSDFAVALNRAEDFGCRTKVVSERSLDEMKWNPGMSRWPTPDFAPLHPGYRIRPFTFPRGQLPQVSSAEHPPPR